MIRAADITFDYGRGVILDGVGLIASQGEVVGLIGPNGSGKTTLLRILHAALAPRSGLVEVDDVPVASLSAAEAAKRIAVVFQEAPPELPLTVAEMVMLGRIPHRSSFQNYTRLDYELTATALERVGLRPLADRPYGELSGGEKQRVLIARALAQGADHLLLDEPTNHLDIRYQHEVLTLVRSFDVTTVLVLHDLNLAARFCDRLVLISGGTVAAAGPVAEVLDPPILEPVYGMRVHRTPYTDCVQLSFHLPAEHHPSEQSGHCNDPERTGARAGDSSERNATQTQPSPDQDLRDA